MDKLEFDLPAQVDLAQFVSDVSMHGFIGRGMVELNPGLIRSGEDSPEGAVICFALPV